MVNQKREFPKATRGAMIGGGTISLSGALIFLGAGFKTRADYGGDGAIPDSVIFDLNTITGKLNLSAFIILAVGMALMTAGLIYGFAKSPKSDTLDNTKGQEQELPGRNLRVN